MIISSVTCKTFGQITVELRDISELFTGYGAIFKKTFNLTEKAFNKIYKFKKDRGGFLVVIKDKKNVLAFFTLSFTEFNFLELGDVVKLDRTLPRETFAIAMNRAFNLALQESKQNGIYGYPNPHAVNLEKMAGFKENSFYVETIIPGGMYSGNDDDVETFGVKATLLASKQLSDDIVYHITKSVFNNFDNFRTLHPVFSSLKKGKSMIIEGNSAPTHTGALRYYLESGMVDRDDAKELKSK